MNSCKQDRPIKHQISVREKEHMYKSLHEVVLVVVHEDVVHDGIVCQEIETQRPDGPSSLLLGIVCHGIVSVMGIEMKRENGDVHREATVILTLLLGEWSACEPRAINKISELRSVGQVQRVRLSVSSP